MTRSAINAVLQALGKNGLSQRRVRAGSSLKAIQILLAHQHNIDYSNLLRELKRQKLVEFTEGPNTVNMSLSIAGAHRLQKYHIQSLTIRQPKKWDGNWRLVTFDVPLNHSANRLKFTSHLQKLNFYMLQRSLWVHPYPCFDEIEEIASYYNLWRYCSIMEISSMDSTSEAKLNRHFLENP